MVPSAMYRSEWHPGCKDPDDLLVALSPKVRPVLQRQWLAGGTQHSRMHESPGYRQPLPRTRLRRAIRQARNRHD
jgi:hypothetical protein